MSDAAAQRRARQTVINLSLSLAATLGIVLIMVLIVPRDDTNRIKRIDYQAVAAEATRDISSEIYDPELPADWWSNSSRWSPGGADGVANWYAGFVGPQNQYLGVTQGIGVNPTWIAEQIGSSVETGTLAVDGTTWRIFESEVVNDPPKTKDYIMLLEIGDDAVLLYGTAKPADFAELAQRIVTEVKASGDSR